MVILTCGNLSSIWVANMDLMYQQFFHSVGGEGLWLRWWMGWGYCYFSQRKYHFIRVHENLVQHPSNNIEYVVILTGKICRQFRLLRWTSFFGRLFIWSEGRVWGKGDNIILASCEYHFIRVLEKSGATSK